MPLKSIKNLFIQTEYTEETSDPKKSTENVETPTNQKNISTSMSKPIASKDVEKFVEVLTKDIQNSNLEGYDYLEFKTSIEELKESGLTLEQAIKSASIAVKSLTTPQKILESISHYIQIVDKNKTEFEGNVVQKLKELISADEKELKQTLAEIDRLKNLEQTLIKKIDENKRKADANSNGFSEAYKIVISSMKEDEALIKKVLGDK